MAAAFRRLCALAVASALLGGAAPATAAPGLLVGVDDDSVKWLGRPDGVLNVHRDLGLNTVRVTIAWRHGRVRPNRLIGIYLHRIATVVAAGHRVVLAVYGQPEEAPTDDPRAGSTAGSFGTCWSAFQSVTSSSGMRRTHRASGLRRRAHPPTRRCSRNAGTPSTRSDPM
jgi:hypothetical protein